MARGQVALDGSGLMGITPYHDRAEYANSLNKRLSVQFYIRVPAGTAPGEYVLSWRWYVLSWRPLWRLAVC